MKRFRTKTAILLLAIYLPVWLLSSFHVHAHELIDNDVECEHHSSGDVDEDNCLLCQFQQLVYDETPQVVVTVSRHEIKMEANPSYRADVSAFRYTPSLRAPPVLL